MPTMTQATEASIATKVTMTEVNAGAQLGSSAQVTGLNAALAAKMNALKVSRVLTSGSWSISLPIDFNNVIRFENTTPEQLFIFDNGSQVPPDNWCTTVYNAGTSTVQITTNGDPTIILVPQPNSKLILQPGDIAFIQKIREAGGNKYWSVYGVGNFLPLSGGTLTGGLTVPNPFVLSGIPPDKALAINGSQQVLAADTSLVELNYLSGVTSAVQTQLNSKLSTTLATGKILRGNGSNVATASTASYPDTITANRLLYSSTANNITELTNVNSAILTTDASGVPALRNALPGFTLPTTGGTASTLDYYEDSGNVTISFTGTFAGDMTARFIRIGKFVMFYWADFTGTSTASNQRLNATISQTRWRPQSNLGELLSGVNNGTATLCNISVRSDGVIAIGIDVAQNFFAGSGNCGIYGGSMCWRTS